MVTIHIERENGMRRPLVLAGIGAFVVAVATALSLWHDGAFWDTRSPAPSEATTAGPVPVPPVVATDRSQLSRLPSFDVVRVQPDGDAVIAGRGQPGQQITIMSGETPLGAVTADADGEWVFVPDEPLLLGTHRLTLTAQDGKNMLRSDEEVVVVITPHEDGTTTGGTAVAVKTSRSGSVPTTVLQSPSTPDATRLAVVSVDDDGHGRLSLSGSAAPQSQVRLYLDDRYLGDTLADALGSWRFLLATPLPSGRYVLRADQMGGGGKVIDRAHIPLLVGLPYTSDTQKVVVERGQSLWRIARSFYGDGKAYTLIYAANRADIDDPDRIYPGQVFQLPASR